MSSMPVLSIPHTLLTDEESAEIETSMVSGQIVELQGVDIHIGQHPTKGAVMLVMPASGPRMLLSIPAAIRSFLV